LTMPCGVRNSPKRAPPSVASSPKLNAEGTLLLDQKVRLKPDSIDVESAFRRTTSVP
jgi:hypothetical protein